MTVKNLRAYPNWLKAYVAHQRFSESPTRFHFWTGVSTIAGALRRRVWIDQRAFQWTPNFYVVLVGPAGVARKSTSIRQGIGLLSQVKGVHLGAQSTTWQALLDALGDCQEGVELPGKSKPEVMSCMTVVISELGTFIRPDNREFLDFLTEIWDGQKAVFSRRTVLKGELKLTNPWLNIIGCTTPAWLKDNFSEILVGGGFASRVIFVYANQKRQLVAYPGLEITGPEYEAEEGLLTRDLQQIAMLKGGYELTPEAIDWGVDWYNRHHNDPRPAHLASDSFDGYLDRKQSHIHKLAIVLAAAQGNELKITTEHLIEATAHITDLELDMINVFSSIGVAPTAQINTKVLSLVRNHGTITYRDLWKLCFHTIPPRDFKESVNAAVDAGYVTSTPFTTPDGKKDSMLHYVSPITAPSVVKRSQDSSS
jgi:hypothetical protein